MKNTTNNQFDQAMTNNTTTAAKVELTPEQQDAKNVLSMTKAIAHTVIQEKNWIKTAMFDLEYKENVRDIHRFKKRAWRVIQDRKWEDKLNAMHGRPLKEVALELQAMFTIEIKEVAERRDMWIELESASEEDIIATQKKLGLI